MKQGEAPRYCACARDNAEGRHPLPGRALGHGVTEAHLESSNRLPSFGRFD